MSLAPEAIAIEVAQPDQVRVGLPRSRFLAEADARAAITSRGGEVLSSLGAQGRPGGGHRFGTALLGPATAGTLGAGRPLSGGGRQAALDEIGNLDRLVELRDARETSRPGSPSLGDRERRARGASRPGGERHLTTAEIAAVRTWPRW